MRLKFGLRAVCTSKNNSYTRVLVIFVDPKNKKTITLTKNTHSGIYRIHIAKGRVQTTSLHSNGNDAFERYFNFMNMERVNNFPIRRFFDHKGTDGWMSNFFESPIEIDGRVFPTVEHYYQAMKFKDSALFERVLQQPNAWLAKDLASSATPIDWTIDKKVEVMRKGLFAKFYQHSSLRKKLIETGDDILIEASPLDSFWGEGRYGLGGNMMGLLLMEVRTSLTEASVA